MRREAGGVHQVIDKHCPTLCCRHDAFVVEVYLIDKGKVLLPRLADVGAAHVVMWWRGSDVCSHVHSLRTDRPVLAHCAPPDVPVPVSPQLPRITFRNFFIPLQHVLQSIHSSLDALP